MFIQRSIGSLFGLLLAGGLAGGAAAQTADAGDAGLPDRAAPPSVQEMLRRPTRARALDASVPVLSFEDFGFATPSTPPTYALVCPDRVPGLYADVTGQVPVGNALQRCIDATADYGTLEIPYGIFLMNQGLDVTRPINLRTAGSYGQAACFDMAGNRTAAPCSMLVASPALYHDNGLLQLGSNFLPTPAHDIHIDHIFLNGNRAARLGTPAAQSCYTQNRAPGTNAGTESCVNCSFVSGGSSYGLCGSGFAWGGNITGSYIAYNFITNNGDRTLVSDGITIGIGQSVQIASNFFSDNSDVQLILFGGPGAWVHHNAMLSRGAMNSFASLMLDNMGEGGAGDLGHFTNADVSYNYINCSYGTAPSYYGCDIGFNVGPYAWYSLKSDRVTGNPPIQGGNIHHNTVYHARVGILMSGAGTQTDPTQLDNTNAASASQVATATGLISDTTRTTPYDQYYQYTGCPYGQHVTADYFADVGSVVNYAAAQPPWAFGRWRGCI